MKIYPPKASKIFLILAILCFYSQTFSQVQADPTPKPTPTPIFIDKAAESGLNFTHFNGMTGKLYLPEIMGSGAAFFDFDNDGDLDVFLIQGKMLEENLTLDKAIFPPVEKDSIKGKLFRNDLFVNADGERQIKFTDVTEKSGIVADGYGFGVATGDVNNDGFTDLYICNLGSNKLYLNKGDGTFADQTQKSKTDDPRWSIGASFFDYDRDGFLDLMVVNYAHFDLKDQPKCFAPTSAKDYCGPKAFRQVGNSIFRNRGDGTFDDTTTESGISKDFGHALGIITADFNDDNWIDIYVANDGDPNLLWLNQKNGKFENEAFISGSAVNREGKSEASMGVAVGDFNQDGTEDLFITHLMDETHTLYKNTGEAIFEDITPQSRIGLPDKRLTGFGTYFLDYDNDCLPDIFIANGSVKLIQIIKRPGNTSELDERYPLGQLNQLFRNTGNEMFEEVSEEAGESFKRFAVSRGAAFGDIDNDGDTDILISNNSGKAELLINQIGSKNNWLGLKLIGKDGKRDNLGAKIELFFDEKNKLLKRTGTDGSYVSAHDPRVIFGLAKNEKIEKIRLTWASGKIEEWKNPAINQYLILKEGSANKYD